MESDLETKIEKLITDIIVDPLQYQIEPQVKEIINICMEAAIEEVLATRTDLGKENIIRAIESLKEPT